MSFEKFPRTPFRTEQPWATASERINTQTMKKWGKMVVTEYVRLGIVKVVIYYYLERENYKVLKFLMNNLSCFEMSHFLF